MTLRRSRQTTTDVAGADAPARRGKSQISVRGKAVNGQQACLADSGETAARDLSFTSPALVIGARQLPI
jgi:hypothetical protein